MPQQLRGGSATPGKAGDRKPAQGTAKEVAMGSTSARGERDSRCRDQACNDWLKQTLPCALRLVHRAPSCWRPGVPTCWPGPRGTPPRSRPCGTGTAASHAPRLRVEMRAGVGHKVCSTQGWVTRRGACMARHATLACKVGSSRQHWHERSVGTCAQSQLMRQVANLRQEGLGFCNLAAAKSDMQMPEGRTSVGRGRAHRSRSRPWLVP